MPVIEETDEGEILLSVCGGMGLDARQLLQAGKKIKRHVMCDVDPAARTIASSMMGKMRKRHQGVPDMTFLKDGRDRKIHDMRLITREMIHKLKPTLVVVGWPCCDLSALNKTGKALEGRKSGLFKQMLDILRWSAEARGDVRWLAENVFFRDRFPTDWRIVCSALGKPVIFDAARVCT